MSPSLTDRLLVPDWPAPANVRALQTTRLGGVSVAPYASLNLGSHVGDAPLNVERNRMLLCTVLPAEPVWLEQVHGTVVADAGSAGSGCDTLLAKPADCGSSRNAATHVPNSFILPFGDGCRTVADACIARRSGSVCVVMTADCLPVLLCDKAGSVVAAVHAGWKGLAAGVIEAAVLAMAVPPQNLMAWMGPAISRQAFEVGEDVRAVFMDADQQAAAAFIPGQAGKYLADIYALARLRLKALGISQIYGGDRCTYSEPGQFFSYRRDGVTGRQGTFIWLEKTVDN